MEGKQIIHDVDWFTKAIFSSIVVQIMNVMTYNISTCPIGIKIAELNPTPSAKIYRVNASHTILHYEKLCYNIEKLDTEKKLQNILYGIKLNFS